MNYVKIMSFNIQNDVLKIKEEKNFNAVNSTQNVNFSEIKVANIKLESPMVENENMQNEEKSTENAEEKSIASLQNKINDKKKELSEGEASSGFETVSSAGFKNELEDLDLSSQSEDFNVIVKIENDLAVSKKKEYIREKDSPLQNHDKNFISARKNNKGRSNCYSSKLVESKSESYRKDVRSKDYKDKEDFYRKRTSRKSSEDRQKTYSREKKSSERDNSRGRRSYDRDLRGDNNFRYERYRRSRESEKKRSKSPYYRDSRSMRDVKDGGNFNKVDSLKSNPKRKSYPGNKSKFPNDVHKTRRSSNLSSDSDDSWKHSTSSSRNRKRRRSFSISPPFSVWNRLGRLNPTNSKKEENDRWSKKKRPLSQDRKKERTPFLVELERKLKESELVKNSINKCAEIPLPPPEVCKTLTSTELPPLPIDPPPTDPPLPNSNMFPGNPSVDMYPAFYSTYFIGFPRLSLDNLPLVVGSSGLPVHITMTGEQIPHDIDGRRIPVGPSGQYLPLDPNGRLFPHIVSPENTAVPIHLSADGVLRLPNLEPVPFGPPHQLPINIDGNVIPIGPDSKPLYPCPNLPKHPPTLLAPVLPQYELQSKPQQLQVLSNCIPHNNLSEKGILTQAKSEVVFSLKDEKVVSYDKNLKKINQRREVLKVVEIENNIIKKEQRKGSFKCIPAAELKSKRWGEEDWSSSSDMVLDSGDSDPSAASNLQFKTKTDISNNEKTKISTAEEHSHDGIVMRIKAAIKSLSESNYKPPGSGRFILSDGVDDNEEKILPNESPLSRNRISLSYLSPFTTKPLKGKKLTNTEIIAFRFLVRNDESLSDNRSDNKYKTLEEFKPVTVLDIAIQCDITSEIMGVMNEKVVELKNEIVALKKWNRILLDVCRQIREGVNKKEAFEALDQLFLKNNHTSA